MVKMAGAGWATLQAKRALLKSLRDFNNYRVAGAKYSHTKKSPRASKLALGNNFCIAVLGL